MFDWFLINSLLLFDWFLIVVWLNLIVVCLILDCCLIDFWLLFDWLLIVVLLILECCLLIFDWLLTDCWLMLIVCCLGMFVCRVTWTCLYFRRCSYKWVVFPNRRVDDVSFRCWLLCNHWKKAPLAQAKIEERSTSVCSWSWQSSCKNSCPSSLPPLPAAF